MSVIYTKIIFGLLIMAVGVALILILAASLFLGNRSGEYQKFTESHSGELERVRAMMRPIAQVTPANKNAERPAAPTLHSGLGKAGPAGKGLASEIRDDANRLSDQEWENIRFRSTWEFSAVLPAEGRIPLDDAVRRRIRTEIIYRGLGRVNLFDTVSVTTPTWIKGEAPLTTRTEALLDKTETFLAGGDWELPSFQDYRDTMPNVTYLNWATPCAAMLRLGRAGAGDRAASLAERFLEYHAAFRVVMFPFPSMISNVRSWVLCEAPGAPGEAELVRIDAALRRGRWDARQLAALRAAHVMRLREMCRLEENPHPQGGDTRFQWMMDTLCIRGVGVIIATVLRPAALTWSGGTADEVYQNLPMTASKLGRFWMQAVSMFPPELAAREADPPVNLELDLTRLAVAAARYRRAEGHPPNHLDDLVPRYLEPEWRGQGRSCWIIDESAGGTYPDMRNSDDRFRAAVDGYFIKNAMLPPDAGALRPWAAGEAELKRFEKFFRRVESFPVFYQARRVTLPRSCAPAVADDEDLFLTISLYDNYLDRNSSNSSPASPTESALLRRLREGRGDTDVWVVRGFALFN